MAIEKIDTTDSLDKFLATFKQTHVSLYGERRRQNVQDYGVK